MCSSGYLVRMSCSATSETQPFSWVRRSSSRSVKCLAASQGVRVTKLPDGSITYHFDEPSNQRSAHVLQDETSAPLTSSQQDPYILHSLASTAPIEQQFTSQEAAPVTATAVVIKQSTQHQNGTQQPGLNGSAPPAPNWTRKLHWRSQAVSFSQNGNGKPSIAGHHQQAPANGSSSTPSDIQHAQPSDQFSNLDNQLDFENAATDLLIRAYSSRAAAGRLDAALEVLEGVVAAGRIDVLKR